MVTYLGLAPAIAGVVLMVGVVAAVRKASVALGVVTGLAMLVPFIVVPVRIGVQPPVIVVLLAVMACASVVAIAKGRRVAWRDPVLCGQGALAVLITMASILVFPVRQDAEGLQTGLKLALAVTVPLMVVIWIPPTVLRRYGPTIVITSVAVQAAVAVFLYFAGTVGVVMLSSLAPAGYPDVDIHRFLPDGTTVRATGLLVDPNVLGATLAMALPFVMVGSTASRRVLTVRLAVGALLVLALLFSHSRGAWIAAVVAVFGVVVIARPYAAAALALGVGVVVVVLWPEGPVQVMHNMVGDRAQSDALRVGEIQEAIRVIHRYPWFGVGYGDSPDVDVFVGVSNTWLWIAERAGLAAAFCALVAVVGAVVRAVRMARQDDFVRMCAAALGALLVVSMVDHHLASFPHMVALVGMLLGATVVATSRLG